LIGVGFLFYALTKAIGDAGGVQNLLTGTPPTTLPSTPTPPGPNDPAAAFTAVPITAVVGDAITFTNTSAPSPGHAITEWHWVFDDGTSETVTVAPGDPIPKAYAAAGTFNVTLRVTDDGSGSSNTATLPITINPATPPGFPTARYSVNGGAPLIQVGTVIFDAGISTDNAGNDHTHGNLEFYWNFGGAGGRAAGEAPGTSPMGPHMGLESVVYVTPGNYTVMLRVHDTASGNDDNHTINFKVEPITPP